MLDHLAIGVRQWSDAYDRFVHRFGGRWAIGGPSGSFAPFQLDYGTGMNLEFIAPAQSGGFMDRFLEQRGPSPHHITFKVPSMNDTVAQLSRLGLDAFGDRPDLPVFREMFIHPKQTGLGTLLQLIELDADAISGFDGGRPPGFPDPSGPAAWPLMFGLSVSDLPRANELFESILRGTVTDKAEGWFLVTWGPGRTILVRRPGVTPGGDRLWAGAPTDGVCFVLFGSSHHTTPELSRGPVPATRLPHDPGTGIPVWHMTDEPSREN